MSDLERAITSGGDERIELKENGLNKYFVNPLTSDGHLNRGSCTCSPLSSDVRRKVGAVLNHLSSGDASVEDIRIKQRYRIKALLRDSYSDDFNIFFAPSGSDLCFYPLLFSHILEPGKPILSLISCPEELGTGSILANTGRYFSEKTQIKDSVPKEHSINDDLDIEHVLFPARADDGSINDHKQAIYDTIEQHKDTHRIIVNLVIGSKSGIEDHVSIIEDGPKDVTWVVDLCQMRATPKLFNELLAANCLLMITGSKFYQSPPFCGALLVPERYAERIVTTDIPKDRVKGFDTVYAKYDFPPSYARLRSHFSNYENIGLTLRWEAAICESELLAHYSEREIKYAISAWSKLVRERLESKHIFDIIAGQEVTNKSIVSFSIRKGDRLLSHEELKAVYEHICLEGHRYIPQYDRVSIGQPVAYEGMSFLRLALGSRNVRGLIQSQQDMSEDFAIIEMIETIVDEIISA